MTERLGAVLALALVAGAVWFLYLRADLRSPLPGELLLTGQVARGPGQNCWILNADTGERFSFFGTNLRRLQTVGARAKMIVKPEPDRVSLCNQGRMVTVLEFKLLELPDYDSR